MNIFILMIFIQIILESLPVSSSGHLTLLLKFAQFNLPEQIDYFLHGPTIIILMVVFYNQWFFPVSRLIKGFFNKNRISSNINNSSNASYKRLLKIFFKIIKLILVANIVTVFIWFLVKTFFEKQAWFSADITLLCGFCITMFFLFSLKKRFQLFFNYTTSCYAPSLRQGFPLRQGYGGHSRRTRQDEWGLLTKFILLGFVQGVALLPGISRFASVYATARLLHIPTRRAFEITFLLQFPLILAGFFLGFYKLTRVPGWYNIFNLSVVLSITVATIISVFVLFWCRRLAENHKLWRFAFYMFFPISVLITFFVF